MRPYFPTEELRLENEKLMEMFLDTKENVDIDEFIALNASEEYREFIKAEKKRKDALFEQGILV